MCGSSSAAPTVSLRLSRYVSTSYPISLKKIFLASEYPFVCKPLDGNPTKTSPGEMFLPVIILSLSTMPVITPTRSCSPGKYVSGISAVSPPTSDTPVSLHAFAMPSTILSTIIGFSLSFAM